MLSELHWENILLHIVNMIILFVIVRFLVYKPLHKFMQARRERMQAALDEAEQAREETELLRKECELKIAQAEEEARARALEIAGAADALAKTITESARKDSRAIIEKAHEEALAERENALESQIGRAHV